MRTFVLLLLILCLSRLAGLDTLPLHNDEGLHLTRAVEVWNLHPFWEIRDGKIINQWAIALFYPQNAPVFVGRVATIIVSLIGFAAGYALARRVFGATPALLAGALWIASPYLFFFERLALSDAEAGALVVLALWASWRLAEHDSIRWAAFTGLALALAALFKFTAAPFALAVALVVLLRGHYPIERRILMLMIVGLVVAMCFAPPIGYLLLRGDDLFSIAFGWIGGGSGAQMGVGANLSTLAVQLSNFGIPVWSIALVGGLALLVILRRRDGGILLLAVGVPLASIVVLGREVLPRHLVAALPALLVLGGAGIGLVIERLSLGSRVSRGELTSRLYMTRTLAALMLAALALGFAPFALTAYSSPDQLSVPEAIWAQYFSQHSAGYGLREAVKALPQTVTDINAPIIASMTADSCHRANFYADGGATMTCADTPGIADMQAALETHAVIYAVVESVTGAQFPQDAETLNADAERIATYPRPSADSQPVTLWQLTRR